MIGIAALLRRHTSTRPGLVATAAAPVADELAEQMAARAADVVSAVLVLVSAAESGHPTHAVAAAEGVRSEVGILIGALSEAARAGRSADPDAITAALLRRMDTATYLADLAAAVYR